MRFYTLWSTKSIYASSPSGEEWYPLAGQYSSRSAATRCISNPQTADILKKTQRPKYVSLTLFNLNLEPVAWHGKFFSNQFDRSSPGDTRWVFSDGRVFLLALIPIPSLERVQGYLGIETLVLSQHSQEAAHTWLGHIDPSLDKFQAVQIDEGQVLEPIHRALNLPTVLPYDYIFLPLLGSSTTLDLIALAWCILLLFNCLNTWYLLSPRDQIIWSSLGLVILLVSRCTGFDHLSIFASFIYGSKAIGNLLISPFHLCCGIAGWLRFRYPCPLRERTALFCWLRCA